MSKSENGWEPLNAGPDILEWVKVPGAEHVSLQFMKGWPSIIMRAYAADFHAYIEPLRDADSASFTPTNSVATSNHLNGTAMDLNWNSHEFRVANAGFDDAKIARMRDLLAFYNYKGVQIMFWANDWNSPKDAMHHQMGYNTWMNPVVSEFIARFIRADGYSTYRRGSDAPQLPTPPQPPVSTDVRPDILAKATGLSLERAKEILPAVVSGLQASQATNLRRVQYWLAQIGHESGSFKYTEEIAKNGRYAPYIGRTWIQITWDYNYRAFSEWCYSKGLVPTSDYFVVNYRELADLKWAGIGPAWYWTVARTKINALCDAGDFKGVTQAINGGQNGASDRLARLQRAEAVGNNLLALISNAPAPTQGEDELSAEAERKIDVIYQELTKKFVSRSPFRGLGEGPLDTVAGFVLSTDASEHVEVVSLAARLGHPGSLNLLHQVATADLNQYPDRAEDAKLAQALLADISRADTVQASSAVTSRSIVEAAAEPQVVYVQAPEPLVAQSNGETSESTGQIIGQAYDSLEKLQSSGVLNNSESAPLVSALINVLQTKTEQGATE